MASLNFLGFIFKSNIHKSNFLFSNFNKIFNVNSSRQFGLTGKSVRIGCASGFWGDTPTAVPQLVYNGKLDFLVFDYLSEITMSLLVAARQKSPNLGYTPDFVHLSMIPYLKDIKNSGIRVISNAGGINPHSCAQALKEAADQLNIKLKIAVVTGDDLMPEKANIQKLDLESIDSKQGFPKNIHSMNAYLGAGPIAQALDFGADIVITGRCVDSALTLGPLMHTFKWKPDNWDLLASGSLAGHLIECGAQSVGGIFTDWFNVNDWDNIGFPIVEFAEDGRFLVTKSPNTGGLVSFGTVAEQLVYEIGDPKNYLLPDVTCNFTEVRLTQLSGDQVLVEGTKGKPPPTKFKVSATYTDGFRCTAVCPVGGAGAVQKAQKTAELLLKRCSRLFKEFSLEDFQRTHIEILGSEQNYGRNRRKGLENNREVVLWLAVHHNQKQGLEIFSREIASSGTGAAPGLSALVGGRPKPTPVLKLYSFLYPRDKIKACINIIGDSSNYFVQEPLIEYCDVKVIEKDKFDPYGLVPGIKNAYLRELAYIRSGDKGNTANIGVIARIDDYFPYLQAAITSETIFEYFRHLFDSDATPDKVKVYYLPGISAINLVLEDALGGGGIASLRSDPQGKALGQILSDFELKDLPFF